MGGMGLTLRIQDLKFVVYKPKATIVGLFNQLLLLPVIGFVLIILFPMQAELAVGVMILTACPGGVTSNLFTYLAKGDTALSIALTAFSSVITIFSIPFIINFTLNYLLGENEIIRLPVIKTIGQIFIINIVPVAIGMMIRAKKPQLADRISKPVKLMSIIFLMIIIIGAILKEKDHIAGWFVQVGIIALILNLTTMIVGFWSSRLMKLNQIQSISVSIETGVQNGTLAIGIASSPILLNNPTMAIFPAVYSLIMLFIASISVNLFSYYHSKKQQVNYAR